MREHRPLYGLLALCAVVYVACSGTLQVGQHADDARYVMLAQSLLSGRGYTQIGLAGAPPETQYPPVLPLLIAPCLKLSGGALWAARIPACLCALGAVAVAWFLLGRFVTGPTRVVLVSLVALHPLVVGYAGMAMTEAPSLLLTWGVLLLVLRAEGRDPGPKGAVLTGTLLALGVLLRPDVAVLALAILLSLLLARRFKQAAVISVVMFLPLAAWVAYASPPGTVFGLPYLTAFRDASFDPSPVPWRLWQGLLSYLGDVIPQTVGLIFGDIVEASAAQHGLGPIVVAVKWLVGVCVVVGFARTWRDLPPVVSAFVLLRTATLIAFFRFTRYLLPMLPFLFMFLGAGMLVWRRDADLRAPGRRFVVGLFACLLVVALARDLALVVRPSSRKYPSVVAGGAMLRQHCPPGAVVLCNWDAPAFYLHSGRLMASTSVDRQDWAPKALLAEAPRATHLLLVGPPWRPASLPAYLASPDLQLLARAPQDGLWLFRILHRSAGARPDRPRLAPPGASKGARVCSVR